MRESYPALPRTVYAEMEITGYRNLKTVTGNRPV